MHGSVVEGSSPAMCTIVNAQDSWSLLEKGLGHRKPVGDDVSDAKHQLWGKCGSVRVVDCLLLGGLLLVSS